MHKTKVKKLMKKFLFILVLIFSASIAFAQSSKTSFEVDNKYQLLLQKGQRAEKNGEYDEAIVSYEEAYEHSNNVQPLLTVASLYIIRNMPDMAEKTINRIQR